LGFDYSPQPIGFGWDVVKQALLVYRDTNGHLRVPAKFKVPDAEPWPEEMWGDSLGYVVNNIRNNGAYNDHRADLVAMGFDFGSQRKRPATKTKLLTTAT
jgi:Helicase associated domain